MEVFERTLIQRISSTGPRNSVRPSLRMQMCSTLQYILLFAFRLIAFPFHTTPTNDRLFLCVPNTLSTLLTGYNELFTMIDLDIYRHFIGLSAN